jgi:protein ImuB
VLGEEHLRQRPLKAGDGAVRGDDHALGHACRAGGQGARRLELSCYRVDGRLAKLAVGTSRPSRDDAALARLFAEKLERIDPGFGIEAMVLAAPHVEPLADLQLALARSRGYANMVGILEQAAKPR